MPWFVKHRLLVGLVAWVAATGLAWHSAQGGELDRIITEENQAAKVGIEPLPVVDDSAFLRRVYVDLIGRIPTDAEIREFASWPAESRREQLIDRLLQDERFADRWTLFYADMLRLRSQATGGAALMAFVHNAVKTGMPYDEMCRKLIATNGKAGKTPEVGFILGDDADPLAMASITSQVFLGVRMGCAQCHDHPFDQWSRRDFYDLAAYYGKTRRYESNLTRVVFATEGDQSSVLWPPEGVGPASERQPIPARFPFGLEKYPETPQHIQRLEALRAAKLAANAPKEDTGPSLDDLLEASSEKVAKTTSGTLAGELALAEEKKDIRKIDVLKGLYAPSELREQLADKVTDPRNRLFSQALVNRVWKSLVGRGFVEPVDDFRDDNAAAHPQALDYLAEEFVASDFDLRALVRLIVTSDAYQRAHAPLDLDEPTRMKMEEHLLATPVRRMIAESLYDSIVTAGRLFEPKHSPGRNSKTVVDIVRIPKGEKPGDLIEPANSRKPDAMAMADQGAASGYELEGAIELDFTALLNQSDDDEEVALDEMKAMSREEIEAQRMMQQRMMRRGEMQYEEKRVERVVDDNPVFNTSLRMQSPAPDGHFLRVFGQPDRTELGDLRDDSASMRQSLMLLNGRITHEAARVGDLEPMYKLLTGKNEDIEKAVKLAYLEILTRRPTAEELAEGKAIVREAGDAAEGMADLRWVLLNCNEFRFLP
jgi:hypothetical protein